MENIAARKRKSETDGNPAPNKVSKNDDKSELPICKYGLECYRKNPSHFKEFFHPVSDKC